MPRPTAPGIQAADSGRRQRHQADRPAFVEIRYKDGELLVTIRDDGKGIDPQVLAGKAGHFGLPGMHERAKLVGGRLEVWSKRNQGTEIQLSIPAGNAYTELARGGWRRLSLSRKRKDKEDQYRVVRRALAWRIDVREQTSIYGC